MISPERAKAIAAKALAAAEDVGPIGGEPGAHPCDAPERAALGAAPRSSAFRELVADLQALSESERLDVVALVHFGRGDFDSWDEARRCAGSAWATARQLAGAPMLATYLQDALIELGCLRPRYEPDRL